MSADGGGSPERAGKERAMSTTDEASAAAAIAAPPTFPVAWERPGDEQATWLLDRMHFPDPVTPLDDWLIGHIWRGASRSAAHYGYPFRNDTRRINTYSYFATIPDSGEPAALAARERRAHERLQAAMDRLLLTWQEDYLPEIKRHLAVWADFDLDATTLPELVAHLGDMDERQSRVWELHDRIWLPANTAMSMFDDLYRELFGAERAFEGYRLLQGFDNATLASDRALWRLSHRALAEPTIGRALEGRHADGVVAALSATTEGRDFLAALHAYLAEYGLRCEAWSLTAPSWLEDPSPAVAHLRTYLRRPDYDPEAERAALAAEREAGTARARARLGGYPAPVRARFEALLLAAQAGAFLSEEHNFWTDRPCIYHARRLFLALGDRLVALGALAQPADIFYLTPDEIRQTAAASSHRDRRALVAGRQAEMAYFRTIAPPSVLGAPPLDAPSDDPVMRGVDRFFGVAPEVRAEPGVVRGSAGSPGLARGIARVVRSLAEAQTLRPGEILVTGATSPAWTPLFAIAAAIVTDAGGVLSHCAIVAREYRLPAVVGAGAATTTIQDGQLVEVDGDAGVVRIVG
jgi:pyruvate,water dikinase